MRWQSSLLCLLCVTVFTRESRADPGAHYTVRLTRPGQFSRPDVRDLCFSPDGRQLAVAHTRGTTLIRTEDGEVTAQAKLTPRKLIWSRDGRRLLSVNHRERWLIDTLEGTGEPVSSESTRGAIGIQLAHKNGKLIIARVLAGSPVDQLKSVQAGDELTGISDGRRGFIRSITGSSVERAVGMLAGPVGTTVRISVIPHGKLSASTHELVRHEMELHQGHASFRLPVTETANDVVCLTLNDQCEIFDTETGRRVRSFSLNARPVDGLSAVNQKTEQVAVIRWSPESEKTPRPKPELTDEERVRLSSVGNIFGSVRDDFATGETPRGSFAVDVFDVATGRQVRSFAIESEPIETFVSVPSFYGLSFASKGRRLVAGTWSMLHIYDFNSGQRQHVIRPPHTGHSRAVESFAVTDRLAAVGSSDGKVRGMTFPTGELLRTIELPEDESVDAITLSTDGTRLSFFADGVVHLVELPDTAADG